MIAINVLRLKAITKSNTGELENRHMLLSILISAGRNCIETSINEDNGERFSHCEPLPVNYGFYWFH